jgi:hypothetical protein
VGGRKHQSSRPTVLVRCPNGRRARWHSYAEHWSSCELAQFCLIMSQTARLTRRYSVLFSMCENVSIFYTSSVRNKFMFPKYLATCRRDSRRHFPSLAVFHFELKFGTCEGTSRTWNAQGTAVELYENAVCLGGTYRLHIQGRSMSQTEVSASFW